MCDKEVCEILAWWGFADSITAFYCKYNIKGVPRDILFLIRADREKKTKKKMFYNIFESDLYFGTYRALNFHVSVPPF